MNEFNSTLDMNKLTALFFRKTQSIALNFLSNSCITINSKLLMSVIHF